MKRIIVVISSVLVVLILAVAMAVPAFAQTPNTNAPCVAQCATQMGGQHVATCAQTMDHGVSSCAQMSGLRNH